MKKSKFLKPFSFASLALLMGIAGTMAFAPLGATSPQLAKASETVESTTEQGLITPKADDPVIYTTESGLDIKWGNAVPSTYNQSLSSGNLKGFPYFTTTANSTTYTWVIIGRNSDVSVFNYSNIASHLFSSWKTNSTQTYQLASNGTYFFKNIYESTTPAGTAINNVVPSKSYVMDGSPLVANAEIASGCVLVLANECVETGPCNVDNKSDGYNNNDVHTSYRSGETIVNAMQGYYTNSSFGLSTIKNAIQKISSLKTYGYHYNQNSNGINISSTSTKTLADQYIYPLASHSSSTFYWGLYLDANQVKLSKQQLLRGSTYTSDTSVQVGNLYYHYCDVIDTTGVQQNLTVSVNIDTVGYRPAFVLKIS